MLWLRCVNTDTLRHRVPFPTRCISDAIFSFISFGTIWRMSYYSWIVKLIFESCWHSKTKTKIKSFSVILFDVIIKRSILIKEDLASRVEWQGWQPQGVCFMLQNLQNGIAATYASFFLEFCSFFLMYNLILPKQSIKALRISGKL